MANIFRDEAVAYQRQRLYGTVLLSESRLSRSFVALISILAFTLATSALLLQYPRAEMVKGIITTVPGSAKVYASRAGSIRDMLVTEGQEVVAGQILLRILVDASISSTSTVAGDSIRALDDQLSFARMQLEIEKLTTEEEERRLNTAIEANRLELADIRSQSIFQLEIVNSAQQLSTQIGPIVEKGYISRLEQEKRKQSLLLEQQRLQQLALQKTTNEGHYQQFVAQIRRLKIDHSRKIADLKAAEQVLTQQRAKLRGDIDYVVLAPIKGRVAAVQASLGQTVDTRFPLLRIIPEGSSLEAEVYAPSRAIGFIRSNQEVRLMYDAFPFKKFGSYEGRIYEIAKYSNAPTDLDLPWKIDEPVYRIRVSIENSQPHALPRNITLTPGMTLQANIILERRSALDLLFEPISAVRNRL